MSPSEENPVSGRRAASSQPGTLSSPTSEVLTESFRSLSRGTSIMVVSTIVLFFMNFIGRVAVAKELPVNLWGSFNLGVSFTSLLSVVILLGLNSAVARSLAYEQEAGERRAIVRWSLAVSAIISSTGAVLTFLFARNIAQLFHEPVLTGVFQLLAVSVGMGAITPVFASIARGFQDVLPAALFNQIVNPALFVVFVLLFLQFRLGLTGAILAYVIADVVAFVGVVVYISRKLPRLIPPGVPTPPRPDPMLWKLTLSLWGVASLAFVTAYADTLILGAYWPARTVGFYSTAMTLARVVLMGGTALTFIFLPVTAQLARGKAFGAIRTTYITATRWILVLTVPLFLLFAFSPGFAIGAIFGPKYALSAVALQFLAVTAFVSSVVGPVNACLSGLGMQRVQVVTSSTSALTNIALSFSLIPTFGLLGASAAWGIARALYPVLGMASLYRAHRISPFHGILLRPLAVSLAVGIPVFLTVQLLAPPHWVLIPLFLFGSGLFLVATVVTKSLVPNDFIVIDFVERITGFSFQSVRRRLGRYVSEAPVADAPLPSA